MFVNFTEIYHKCNKGSPLLRTFFQRPWKKSESSSQLFRKEIYSNFSFKKSFKKNIINIKNISFFGLNKYIFIVIHYAV